MGAFAWAEADVGSVTGDAGGRVGIGVVAREGAGSRPEGEMVRAVALGGVGGVGELARTALGVGSDCAGGMGGTGAAAGAVGRGAEGWRCMGVGSGADGGRGNAAVAWAAACGMNSSACGTWFSSMILGWACWASA